MKKILSASSLYLGAFSMAFAGFLYLKIDHANNTHDETTAESNIDLNAVTPASKMPAAFSADIANNAHFSKTETRTDSRLTAGRTDKKYVAGHSSADNSNQQHLYTLPSSDDRQNKPYTAAYNYTGSVRSEQNRDNPEDNTHSYSGIFVSSASGTDSIERSSVTASDSYSNTPITADSSTGTAMNTYADNTTEITSDGSEFLPDGKSQEDLAKSLSKDPRVYSIEDYQQASITCGTSYGAPSAHAELIYKLKGC